VAHFTFFYQGKVQLYGYVNKDQERTRFLVANLPEGSFYGDFEIFFELLSNYDLQATHYLLQNEEKIPLVKVYQI